MSLVVDRITAIANHHTEFGGTDAMCKVGNCLLSSAYDYDEGVGFLNSKYYTATLYLLAASFLLCCDNHFEH